MSREPEEKRIVHALEKRMLHKLRVNAHKPHWHGESIEYLLERLREEVREVEDAIEDELSSDAVYDECADVANIAAMIADLAWRTATQADQAERGGPVKRVKP